MSVKPYGYILFGIGLPHSSVVGYFDPPYIINRKHFLNINISIKIQRNVFLILIAVSKS